MSKAGWIVGEVSIRQKGGHPVIYWRERRPNGKLRQHQVYWGNLRTRNLNRLLYLVNQKPPRAKHRIARMIGLKFGDVSDIHLQISKMFRKYILGELKKRERAAHKIDKRFLTGIERQQFQAVRQRDFFSEFFNRLIKMRVGFERLEKERGQMETWTELRKMEFLDYLKPIEAMIERAKKLHDSQK